MSETTGGPVLGSLVKLLGPVRRIIPGGDVGLALCVLFQLSILILPIPTFLLDMALALSFIASILILLISISLERPLDFSSLPTLLLLTTILRLSLNVATARLILSHGSEGPYAAGHVVAAFGAFLMGGDVVVGGIIFSMLLMVNFVVITKGSSRIAEVSARFYLDSMPGKQMAIDADVSSGTIDEATARTRRAELSEESGFYGAMDGASKFVRGDAISALIITLINIFGGLAMGLLRAHMSIDNALATYTTLTIGDGLVSQIPALLVSTAAGIVVSKGAIEGQMHGKLAMQLGSSPNPLMIASAAAGVLALLPGLPTIPFLLVSTLSGAAAWHRFRARNAAMVEAVPDASPADNAPPAVTMLDVVRVEL
jgi:flagellar biosynthesis protein FlhA